MMAIRISIKIRVNRDHVARMLIDVCMLTMRAVIDLTKFNHVGTRVIYIARHMHNTRYQQYVPMVRGVLWNCLPADKADLCSRCLRDGYFQAEHGADESFFFPALLSSPEYLLD